VEVNLVTTSGLVSMISPCILAFPLFWQLSIESWQA